MEANFGSLPANPASELSLWTERSMSRLLSLNTWQWQPEEGGGYLGSLFQETGSVMVGRRGKGNRKEAEEWTVGFSLLSPFCAPRTSACGTAEKARLMLRVNRSSHST